MNRGDMIIKKANSKFLHTLPMLIMVGIVSKGYIEIAKKKKF